MDESKIKSVVEGLIGTFHSSSRPRSFLKTQTHLQRFAFPKELENRVRLEFPQKFPQPHPQQLLNLKFPQTHQQPKQCFFVLSRKG